MSTESNDRLDLTPYANSDIRVSEVIWPRASEAARGEQQQHHLIKLVNVAGTGLILDCTLVEVGNSEIISLLMRVRNHAKKANKEIALFNVPDTLNEIIRLCNLRSVLPIADDSVAAKKLVYDLSRGKGRWRLWSKSHNQLIVGVAIGLCVVAGIVLWLLFG